MTNFKEKTFHVFGPGIWGSNLRWCAYTTQQNNSDPTYRGTVTVKCRDWKHGEGLAVKHFKYKEQEVTP